MAPPNIATAVGRVMFACGETDDAAPLLAGGTAQYTALLAAFGGDEAIAYRKACAALAAAYAAEGDRVSSGAGKAVEYRSRVALWLSAARGGEPGYAFAVGGGVAGTGTTDIEVVW